MRSLTVLPRWISCVGVDGDSMGLASGLGAILSSLFSRSFWAASTADNIVNISVKVITIRIIFIEMI